MKRISAPAKPAPGPADDEIMTVASLALYLRCAQGTIYRLLKKRQIPAFNLGSDWRFFRSDIDKWIARQYGTNPPVTKGQKSKVLIRRAEVPRKGQTTADQLLKLSSVNRVIGGRFRTPSSNTCSQFSFSYQ